jgi:hypothetical protein
VTYAAAHPDEGALVARAVGAARGRVDGWLPAGNVPNPIRGLRTAHTYDWLQPDADDPTNVAFATVAPSMLAAGRSLRLTTSPLFGDSHARVRPSSLSETLVELGVGQTIDDDRGRQGDESVPNTDQTVLGQVLAALCVPVGEPIETVPPVTRASETAHRVAGEVLAATIPATTASGELELRLT